LTLEEQFEEGESPYAAEGTAGHALAEHLLRKYLKQRTKRPVSEYYTDELVEAVDEYVSFVIEEIEIARRESEHPIVLVEQRIDASEYVDGCFGTADLVIITGTAAQLIDLKLGIAAEEYGSKFFANGATPSGVLTHPNAVKNPKALRESWNATYGGSANSNRVGILEEGMRFERISMPNNEAQFLETRKFQVTEICRIFRVPPHLVADLERATFSNIEFQGISFAVHTIRPWLVRIEQSMNRALFSEKEKGRFYVRINMDGLMRGAYKERMEGYAIARQNGWMSANEIRDLESMNPIPDSEGGNVFAVNGNMVRLDQIGKTSDSALTGARGEGGST